MTQRENRKSKRGRYSALSFSKEENIILQGRSSLCNTCNNRVVNVPRAGQNTGLCKRCMNRVEVQLHGKERAIRKPALAQMRDMNEPISPGSGGTGPKTKFFVLAVFGLAFLIVAVMCVQAYRRNQTDSAALLVAVVLVCCVVVILVALGWQGLAVIGKKGLKFLTMKERD